MTSLVIIFLIIAQCLSFYFIVLLNLKITRLKEIEEKQKQLKDDMDDSIGVYLAEMKDENDRLIQEIKSIKVDSSPNRDVEQQQTKPRDNKQQHEKNLSIQNDFETPKAYVKKAYQQQRHTAKEPTIEEQVIKMYKEGFSISDIAKKLNQGKTEVELLLKFQQ
ncbi:DUF6115 domain-containing protein [Kurthia huakuii]|uniref:DUF6115 domain-containing protein n=1 Tax=Kurthia huakuii TaxID=1421019 RepID=UPI0004973BDD|nr:hypothetical protein [Kurthia huakuii]MBM7698303.1 hypothetical protein [Kurthia huakuii]